MSEQEKRNAIETEGTVTETPKKDPWYIRLYRNPITKKVIKVIGVAGSIIGAGFGGYEIGLHSSGRYPETNLTETEPAKIEESVEETVE